jgi:hypothetical protein
MAENIKNCLVNNMAEYGLPQDNEGVRLLTETLTEKLADIVESYSSSSSTSSQASSGKGGGRGKTNYTKFIRILSTYQTEVNQIDVNVRPQFASNSKTKAIYDENKEHFKFGKIVTIGQLREKVNELFRRIKTKTTPLTCSSFIWGLLSNEDRLKVLALEPSKSEDADVDDEAEC